MHHQRSRAITSASLFFLASIASAQVACSVTTSGGGDPVPNGPSTIEPEPPVTPVPGGTTETGPGMPPPAPACSPAATPAGVSAATRLTADRFKASPRRAVVDSKGRALAGGWATISGSATPVLFVARTLPGGAPDPAFGSDGMAVIDVDDLEYSVSGDFTIDSLDRVVMVGRQRLTSSKLDTFALRLDASGKLDTKFGYSGFVTGLTYDGENSPRGLAVAAVGTTTFIYASIQRSVSLLAQPEDVIVGYEIDAAGVKIPYGFTMQVAGFGRQNDVVAAAGGGGLFVGNGARIYKLTPTGSIDASFGTAGWVDRYHTLLAPLRDGSLVVANPPSLTILSPTALGTPTAVSGSDADSVRTIVERCDGKIVIAEAGYNGARSLRVMARDGKPVPGRPAFSFQVSGDDFILSAMTSAIDPATGVETLFGQGRADQVQWLSALRVTP